MIKAIRRAIVEAVFERELDEDYELGTRYGAEMAKKSFRLQLQLLHDQALKREQPGIAKAISQLGADL